MSKTTHKLLATIPVGDPDIGAEIEAMLTFTFSKGAPAQGPSYASGGQPADPDEIELVKAESYCNGKPSPFYGAYADMEQSSLDARAEGWLEGAGFIEALEQAASDYEAAREYAAELEEGPMTTTQRQHVADLLGKVVVEIRMGEITYAQIDERLNYIQFLLDHASEFAPEANLEAAE